MPGPSRQLDATLRRPGSYRPWYERDDGARLKADRALVSGPYPGLEFAIDSEKQRVTLAGIIVLKEEVCGIETSIATRLDFPPDYPEREPLAYETGGRFPRERDRHFGENGHCCLWLPPKSKWDSHDPQSLLLFLDELVAFYDAQLVYDATGRWPGAAWAHGAAGFVEYLLERLDGSVALLNSLATGRGICRNDPCPCGRGRKFKRCHQSAVEDAARKCGPREYTRAMAYWRQHQPPAVKESRPAGL